MTTDANGIDINGDGDTRATKEVVLRAAFAKDLPKVPGRRDWIDYLDYGVTEATSGRMRAQRIAVSGEPHGTGWHYHVCDMQFVYLFKGSITLLLEDGDTLVLNAGDSVLIPGGYRHNEINITEDFDVLEVSVPSDMPTVPCAMPDVWREKSRLEDAGAQ